MSQGTQAVSEQWIDISLGLHDGMVHWPDNPPVQIGFVMAIDKGDVCNVSKISMGVHSGTHMDAPLHFFQDGKSIDTMPLSATIGRARVIEIQDTESIKVAELEPHRIQMGEPVHGKGCCMRRKQGCLLMVTGYTRPLYLLPFDHRAYYISGLFGWKEPLNVEQMVSVAHSKHVIYAGFQQAIAEHVPKDRA